MLVVRLRFFMLVVVSFISIIEFFFLGFLVLIILRRILYGGIGWVGVRSMFLFDGMSLLLTILTT